MKIGGITNQHSGLLHKPVLELRRASGRKAAQHEVTVGRRDLQPKGNERTPHAQGFGMQPIGVDHRLSGPVEQIVGSIYGKRIDRPRHPHAAHTLQQVARPYGITNAHAGD